MIRKRWIALFILVLAIILLYNFPVPQPSFNELYQSTAAPIRNSLADFRKNYPPKTLTVGEQSWNYLSVGRGDKAILFLHGMAGSYDIWWQQILNLKEEYRVVSVSYPPAESLKEMGDGIEAVLKAEGISKVYVIGSSLGGYFTQYLVATYPDLIEKAIFGNTFPPNKIILEKNKSLGNLLPYLPEWAVMLFLRKSTESGTYPASGHSELLKAFMFEQSYGMMSKKQFLARFYCVIDQFSPPNIEKLNIPVLILEADNDPLVEPQLREMLKKTYPTAKVKTLHAVGHFSYLNAPETYSKIIREFFFED